jgi:catalase
MHGGFGKDRLLRCSHAIGLTAHILELAMLNLESNRPAASVLATLMLVLSCCGSLAQEGAKETPESMVKALHAAFGEHHARAVHTKGVMLEGEFQPSPDAASLVSTPIFSGGTVQAVARFSLFAGVPTLPDNDDGASPVGLGIKIKGGDGQALDIEVNQHKDFIVRTFDEFATFLRAVATTKPDTPHPNPVEQFLSDHPHAKQFLETRTYPVSYAHAAYFGVNSLKFTNAAGKSAVIRYKLVPRAGEQYLAPDERKTKSASYLNDEILQRVAKEPVVFDWFAQVAEDGDKIEDPSIAWPDSRRLVKLGTFVFNKTPANPEVAQKELLLLPGQPHPGIEPADPMLVLRNAAYPISFNERQ